LVEAANGRTLLVDRVDRKGDEAGFELQGRGLVGSLLGWGAALNGGLSGAEGCDREDCEGYDAG
jgi:hypothetical protein